MRRRQLSPALIPLAAASAAVADHSAEVQTRRQLNPARGIPIVRSPVRKLQQIEQDDEEKSPYLSACIGRYPGYNLELGAWVNPNGHVRAIYLQDGGESGTEILFEFDVYENEDHCKECRIHIATGTTCEDANEVGGHYWNSDVFDEDPWTRRNGAYYNSNNNGKAIGAFEIDNGYTHEENLGHAVVIYAMDGRAKIGCGILEAGDRGMHCDTFAGGDGERGNGDDESHISQDYHTNSTPSSPSTPSSTSASAPSPSAPSPTYSSDMSFDHGDRSDDEVRGDGKKHETEGIASRRGHLDNSDEEDSEDASSAASTESSETKGSEHGKMSKKSKGSSKKTKNSKGGKGNSSDSKRHSNDEKKEEKQSKQSEMNERKRIEGKQKSTKSAKMVRRRQRL